MALDPNQLDDDKLPLTADHDDGYDELEERLSLTPPRKKAPVPLIILGVLLVGMGGAYFAFEYFMGGDDVAIAHQRPVDLAPNLAPDMADSTPTLPEQAGNLPPSDGLSPLPNDVTDPNAVDPNAPINEALDPDVATTAPDGTVPADVSTVDAAVASSGDVTAAAPSADPTDPVDPVDPAVTTDPAVSADPAAAEAVVADAAIQPQEAAGTLQPVDQNVMPVPAQQQLQPIDPNAVVEKAATSLSPQQQKTADTLAAVNEILGTPTTPSPAVDGMAPISTVAPNATPAAAPPVEVKSRAHPVIKVTKSYSAQSPQAMIAAGDRVLDSQQYGAAIDIFDKQLRSNPSDPQALAGKALALQKSGRSTEALDAYQRLIDLNPRDVQSLTNYLGLLQKQKPDEAMSRLNSLSQQYPDNAAVAGQIASVFAGQNDAPSALRYFMKAKALDDRNPTYPFNIAVLYDRMGNGPKAKSFYREALTLARGNRSMAPSVPVDAIINRMRTLN